MASSPARAAGALRHLVAVSMPGLEKSLERELQALRVPGQLEVVPGGVAVTGTQESLWRIVLQSRIAEAVRVRLGEPFHAADERTLNSRLQGLPWEQYLQLEGPEATLPSVRVYCTRSRLYHTRMVEERVLSAIESRIARENGKTLQGVAEEAAETQQPAAQVSSEEQEGSSQQQSADEEAESRRVFLPPPEVHVQLRYDECRVSVRAGGPLHQRGYRKAVGEEPLRETLAAACVLASPLLRRLTRSSQSQGELILWDPFCGSGVVLLEALGIGVGALPGPKLKRYPFSLFPDHDEEEFESLVGSLAPSPHPALPLLRLLGSDISREQVQRSQRNLRRLLRRVDITGAEAPADDAGSPSVDRVAQLPCNVDFCVGAPQQIVQRLSGRPTMILTYLPSVVLPGARSGFKRRRAEVAEAYSQLGRLLRQQREWQGVFCLTANPDELRQHTEAEWTSELRFRDDGRWMELLQWTGNSSDHGRQGRREPRGPQ